jgi:thiol-disulfide isomerase/thioredoxin
MKIDFGKLNGILEAKAGRAIDRLDGLKCYSPEFQETLDAILLMLEVSKELDTYDTECQDCKQRKNKEADIAELRKLDKSLQKTYEPIDLTISYPENRLVLFYSEGCQPCREARPVVKELANELGIGLEEVCVDTPEGTMQADKYDVRSWPTFFIIKDGQIADIGHGYDLSSSPEQNKEYMLRGIRRYF